MARCRGPSAADELTAMVLDRRRMIRHRMRKDHRAALRGGRIEPLQVQADPGVGVAIARRGRFG